MLPYCIAGIFFVEGEVIFVFFRSRVGSAKNLASENYAYVQIELHMHSNSSTTCWCCSILRRQLYQLWRAHCLLAAVCATNECVQTACTSWGRWEGWGMYNKTLEREANWDKSLVDKCIDWLYAHVFLHNLLSEYTIDRNRFKFVNWKLACCDNLTSENFL